MRFAVLAAISFYKRHVSPYKGFSCAYRVHTGRSSCSSLGYRAVRRFGVWGGLKALRQRTHLCGVAHRRFTCRSAPSFGGQRGFCDIGCDLPCHGSCCELPCETAKGFEVFQCLDCASGCSDRKRSAPGDERSVYLPPNREPGRVR